MTFEIVLKNGQEIIAYTKQEDSEIFKHWLEDGLLVVQENEFPNKTTVIKIEDVSYLRFNSKDTVKPI